MLEKSYLCGINNNDRTNSNDEIVVVICLKSLTFVVSITTSQSSFTLISSCDLLEKSYLCGINNNRKLIESSGTCVVICLKSLTFVVSITTRFKFIPQRSSCDLLEKSYLCGINNNLHLSKFLFHQVVICLKSLTFVVSITTALNKTLFKDSL